MRIDSPEKTAIARQMRSDGHSWSAIADALGMSREQVRYRVDDDYAERMREASRGPSSMIRLAAQRISEAELFALLDNVPRDTRSPFARMAGDPLPGRSALDQKRVAS